MRSARVLTLMGAATAAITLAACGSQQPAASPGPAAPRTAGTVPTGPGNHASGRRGRRHHQRPHPRPASRLAHGASRDNAGRHQHRGAGDAAVGEQPRRPRRRVHQRRARYPADHHPSRGGRQPQHRAAPSRPDAADRPAPSAARRTDGRHLARVRPGRQGHAPGSRRPASPLTQACCVPARMKQTPEAAYVAARGYLAAAARASSRSRCGMTVYSGPPFFRTISDISVATAPGRAQTGYAEKPARGEVGPENARRALIVSADIGEDRNAAGHVLAEAAPRVARLRGWLCPRCRGPARHVDSPRRTSLAVREGLVAGNESQPRSVRDMAP